MLQRSRLTYQALSSHVHACLDVLPSIFLPLSSVLLFLLAILLRCCTMAADSSAWPVKDVRSSKLCPSQCARSHTLPDCLLGHCWLSHTRGNIRVAPLASRLSILFDQGLPEGRRHQYSCSRSGHDDFVFFAKVGRNHSTRNTYQSLTKHRGIFLPVMIVTLPLPSSVTRYLPFVFVSFLQWFAFWTFSALLTIPWLMCIYQLVTHSVGRTKTIKHVLDEISAPKVVVVMPCYKELPDILLRTVNSLVDCDYPATCLHIFLSFDGDQEDELYLNTIKKLGIPLVRRSGFPSSIDVMYRDTRITVSRFQHGGKRHCQKKTFKLIDSIYNEYLQLNDNMFVLFIDSDCILDKVCIQNFIYEMELKPRPRNSRMLAMTGVITATTEKNTLLTLLQDIEYIHGQLFERAVESGCGAVTCLPGALTILRFSAFRKLGASNFLHR